MMFFRIQIKLNSYENWIAYILILSQPNLMKSSFATLAEIS